MDNHADFYADADRHSHAGNAHSHESTHVHQRSHPYPRTDQHQRAHHNRYAYNDTHANPGTYTGDTDYLPCLVDRLAYIQLCGNASASLRSGAFLHPHTYPVADPVSDAGPYIDTTTFTDGHAHADAL